MKTYLLILAAIGGLLFYGEYLKSKVPPVNGVPPTAVLAETLTIAGRSIPVYIDSTGYYAVYDGHTIGPATQAQVADLLRLKSFLGNL